MNVKEKNGNSKENIPQDSSLPLIYRVIKLNYPLIGLRCVHMI